VNLGKATLVRRDMNRLAKTYPFVIRTPKYSYASDTRLVIESTVVDFGGGDSVTYYFRNPYSAPPTVVATSLNDSFNVSIISVSTSSVTVKASAANSSSASVVVLEGA
jgi:hypothetical protein